MLRSWLSALVSLAILLISGCASAATGTSTSVMLTSTPDVSFEANMPAGSALVVIRYPAMVETDAKDAYHTAYLNSAIGGRVSEDAKNNPDSTGIADATIVKSNYFALSLYKELAQRLPDHSVLLSPHTVTLDEKGLLTSKPLTSAERIASVLTVDFSTYSYPDPEKIMGREPLTFGDLITPLVVVQTDYRASAPTKGLLLSSVPLIRHAGGNAHSEISNFFDVAQTGTLETDPRELHFITFLTGKRTQQLSSQPISFVRPSNAVQTYPLEKIVLNRSALASLSYEGGANNDPLERVFSSSFANRIVAILNSLDTEKAAMVRRAAAISNFDQNLAALSVVGTTGADYETRMKYAERLLEAERKYLSIQSLRIFDGIHNGEMGAQVRDMLIAERDVLDERRKLAKQQNQAAAGAIFGALLTAVVISEAGSDGASAAEVIAADLLARTTVYAAAKAISINRISKSLSSDFLSSMAPVLEEQLEVQIDLLGSSETITAIRFDDLREKLQVLYADNQRAIDTFASNCAYTHSGTEPVGIWQGVCENGRAAGVGIGIASFQDGTRYEYFGEALDGRPNGTGFMIEHSRNGTRSYEGEFTNGTPNGIVRVSTAGRPDQLRVYRNGSDTGSALPDSDYPRLFSKNSAVASQN